VFVESKPKPGTEKSTQRKLWRPEKDTVKKNTPNCRVQKRYDETNGEKKSGSIKDNIERNIENEYGRIVDDILKDTERLYQFNKRNIERNMLKSGKSIINNITQLTERLD